MSPPPPPPTGITLQLYFRQGVSQFISKATTASPRFEVACFGTRGDGKTQGAFGAAVVHAQQHHAAGYPLPVRWIWPTDTFESHRQKTHASLTEAHWGGCWTLQDSGHLAVFSLDGVELVHAQMFGVEDADAMKRVRTACHGMWFEETAPAMVLGARGMTERAWTMALTSRRLESYHRPAIMTLNYPEAEHWTWQRFVARPLSTTDYVRIPPGEFASEELRAEFLAALEGQPDMIARLYAGEPATVYSGPLVTEGLFSHDEHVAVGRRLVPEEHLPLWLGHDGGLTPATIIGQRVGRELRILASLVSEHAGMRQHVGALVRPWLAEHAPWTLEPDGAHLLRHRYDPSLKTGDQGDSDSSPDRVLRETLGGEMRPGAVSWAGRRDPLLAALNIRDPRILLDPLECRPLIQALGGRWHYPESTDGSRKAMGRDEGAVKDHPWSDLGDALCYLIGGVQPLRSTLDRATMGPRYATVSRNAWETAPQRRAPSHATSSTARW